MKTQLLGVVVLLLSSAAAHADWGGDSRTGSLYLSGEIPVVTTIKVEPNGNDNLILTSRARDLKVADVREENNTRRGYFVTLQSQNDGNFELEDSRIAKLFNKIPYSAKYNGEWVQLSSHARTIYSSPTHNLMAQDRKVPFTVSYEGQDPAKKLAGKYSDTLTFMITAR